MATNITTAHTPSPLASPLGDPATLLRALPIPAATPLSYAVTALLVLAALYSVGGLGGGASSGYRGAAPSNRQLPIIYHTTRRWDLGGVRRMMDFFRHGFELMEEARRRFADKPFRIYTDVGEQTILPPRYANEVKSDPRVSFVGPLRRAMHIQLRGFDILRTGGMENHLVLDVVRQDLTRELGKVTGPLTEETSFVLKHLLTDDAEWHSLKLKDTVQEMVARLSSRVFLGDELCRNREWLDITIQATITSMTAAAVVGMFPYFLRPLVNEVLPLCRAMRNEHKRAAELILPIIAKRQALRAQLEAAGASEQELKAAVKNDGIEWFARMSGRDGRFYKPELAQITLSVAAIHTTSDLMTQVILDLASHPDVLAELRAELVDVLGSEGWKKTALYGLKKLDSCIRETQRLKPIGIASMRREVTDDITLSDGTLLRKGSEFMVSALSHWDPALYTNPHEWDGLRFYRLRQQPGNENLGQAAITSGDHLAFGHGQHACPGRFFAVNEAKIALAHLVMKYDFRIAGKAPTPEKIGLQLIADSKAVLEVRRREPEIDLDSLVVS